MSAQPAATAGRAIPARPARPTSLTSPTSLTAAAAALGFAAAAHAHLGGFEAADGYQPFLNMVQNYNAGQYGANSGYTATSPASITPNTGLWQALSGGFFSGSSVSYATGHQLWDRTYVNSSGTLGSTADQALVITTGHEGWTASPLKYRYDLDANDLGGVAPAATGSSTIDMSFWVRGQLAGPEIGGMVPDGYFGNEIAFLDGGGNIGFMLGLTQRATGDKVTYWDGAAMVESSIIGNGSRFDRWDLTIDLVNDTLTAKYFSFATSTTTTLVSNAPMMNAMNDFSAMTFRSSAGVNNNKVWALDDFRMVVPSPAAAWLLLAGGAMAARRRR